MKSSGICKNVNTTSCKIDNDGQLYDCKDYYYSNTQRLHTLFDFLINITFIFFWFLGTANYFTTVEIHQQTTCPQKKK